MSHTLYFVLALLMTAGVTYLIRVLPLLFIRKKVQNRFLKSFLHYVPYAVLSALAFPAIFFTTEHILAGALAALLCAFFAYRGKNLLTCMCVSVITALLIEGVFLLI